MVPHLKKIAICMVRIERSNESKIKRLSLSKRKRILCYCTGLFQLIIRFITKWISLQIKNDTAPRRKQDEAVATNHYGKDFADLNQIDLEKKYSARELLNQLRSRTFQPFPSAYFVENGKKVYVRVQLEYASDNES